MRLIDADVLKRHIDKLPALPDGNFAGSHSALKALINMQPTVQQEERTETHAETHACDLISRSAVYDRVSRIVSVNHLDPEKVWFTPIGVKALIKELPSAQPEQRWIPCSERLPEERDWYLGIFKEPDTGWINPIPFICDYLLGTKTKATTKEGWILKGHTDREEYIDYYFNLECVAWCELPKPYKEGDTDG